ncbi:hypothetical protein SAMN04488128_103118 [Chitinophaga eiseniae]|uniref:Uncharacterized protein n=1 Tax=Chitinophaga eiseniae TaxID=634771 RepID=A0A1T4SNG8_9BACT|nr:hypothetical protein SAMN04488128_103118 [Chitinophaga eiseniae]
MVSILFFENKYTKITAHACYINTLKKPGEVKPAGPFQEKINA